MKLLLTLNFQIMLKSHYHRCCESQRHYPKSLVSPFEIIAATRQNTDGVLTRTSNVRVVDNVEDFSKMSALDFSLENLVAVGATLNPVSARMSDLEHAINADAQIERAEDFIDSETFKTV